MRLTNAHESAKTQSVNTRANTKNAMYKRNRILASPVKAPLLQNIDFCGKILFSARLSDDFSSTSFSFSYANNPRAIPRVERDKGEMIKACESSYTCSTYFLSLSFASSICFFTFYTCPYTYIHYILVFLPTLYLYTFYTCLFKFYTCLFTFYTCLFTFYTCLYTYILYLSLNILYLSLNILYLSLYIL